MAIDEDLLVRLTQEDVLYSSDLGALLGHNSEQHSKNASDRVAALRLHALEGLWRKKNEEIHSSDDVENDDDDILEERNNDEQHTKRFLDSKLPLLLLIPLLRSGARSDPALIDESANILFNYLASIPSGSLGEGHYSEELNALENLLISWGESSSPSSTVNPKVARCLVALSTTRGSLQTILSTIGFLHEHSYNEVKLEEQLGPLLRRLSPYGSDPKPPLPTGVAERWSIKDYKDLCYAYDDREDEFKRRRLAASPGYIYLLSGNEGLVKIGNGRQGTLRGHVYEQNPSLNQGFIAFADGVLLLHSGNERFQVIDTNTLQATRKLTLDSKLLLQSSETLHFISDGAQFYWIRSMGLPKDTEEGRMTEELQVTLDIFDIFSLEAKPQGERILLRRVPGQVSPRTSATNSDNKDSSERQNNRNTSTGLDIKTLFQAPALTCGHFVSFFTYSPQKAIFSGAHNRSGGGSGSGYLSHSFHITSGEFFGKHDLSDVFKQFKRRSLLSSSALVYDPESDLIWMVTYRGITAFHSSNFKSLTFVKKSLRIPPQLNENKGSDVVQRELLRAGAILCSYQEKQTVKSTQYLDIQILIKLLEGFQAKKNIEGCYCTLQLLSKTGRNHPKKLSLNYERWSRKEHPSLRDFAMDVILERIPNDDERLLELISLTKNYSQPELRVKLYKHLSTYKALTSSRVLRIVESEMDFIDGLIREALQEGTQYILSTTEGQHPYSSPLLEFLVNFTSRYAYFTLQGEEGFLPEGFIAWSHKILSLIETKFLPIILERKLYENASYEKTVKSTILGSFLHTLIVILYNPKFSTLEMIKTDSNALYQLWRSVNSIASLQWSKGTHTGMGFLSGIPELDAWETCRIIESPHPITSSTKYEENIHMENVPFIYLKFDTRCNIGSEDKLVILRWNRIIAEFNATTSWPEAPLQIDWPTQVTLKFEAKSKEKLWGFRITISQHASQLAIQDLRLPHMTLLSMSITSLLRSRLQKLYEGPSVNSHEEMSKPLLGLKLLDRCVWDRETQKITRIKLPQSIVTRLRELTGIQLPPLRPSVREALGITALEEGILASVMKHLSLFEVVEDLSFHQKNQSPEYGALVDILGQTHRRINALVRRLHILADLENQWDLEIDCLREGSVDFEDVFFRDYHLNETRWKELTLLAFLKGLPPVDDDKRERTVKELLSVLEREALGVPPEEKQYRKTRKVVESIMEKIELLLKISINIEEQESSGDLMTQSLLISWPESSMTRKKKFLERERSLDDSILQIPNLKRSHKSIQAEGKKSPENDVLNEIFAFVGSNPEKAVSQESFLDAIHMRRRRNEFRNLSIDLMKEILISSEEFEIGAYMASSLTSIIQGGLICNEIYFGAKSLDKIRDNFTQLTSILTGIASKNHGCCDFIVETLCQIPYERDDEACLIANGLVNLLSVLCSENEHSDLAWKGFKSLANRCVAWEADEQEEEEEELISAKRSSDEFGLARQLSVVLTNHLVRVTSSYDEKRNESLEEIISLLVFMSNCQTGKDILSQPSCISDLLELLLERLSPKMMLEIVQLCHVGLPRMTTESLERVHVPTWSLGGLESPRYESNMNLILELILAKLSDFLVPGSEVSQGGFRDKQATPKTPQKKMMQSGSQSNHQSSFIPTVEGGNLSLFVHKRKNQGAHELIQQLLNVNSEVKLFPLGGNISNMEKVVKMDKDMNKINKTQVLFGDASLVFHKGSKLAGHGFVVSVSQKQEGSNDDALGIARDKNLSLYRKDPLRPFISSYMAHSIAMKLVRLLHSLAESSVWADSLHGLIRSHLKLLQNIIKSTESLYDLEEPCELFTLYSSSRKVIAVLSILGAFDWQLKPGDEVQLLGTKDTDTIHSIDEDLGRASLVHFGDVLLKRLSPSSPFEDPTRLSKLFQRDLLEALITLLTPDSEIGIDPLSAALPANGDGWSLKLAVSRVLSEIRTKSCQLLSLYSNDEDFMLSFMRRSYKAVDMLKLVSKDVLPTDDIDLVQRKLKNLKSIYRDCFKPPPLAQDQKDNSKIEVAWNPSTNYPPLSSTLFSYKLTSLAYHGDPQNSTGNLPKGAFIYANSKAVHYYEISVLSLGEIGPDDASILSIGFSPSIQGNNTDDTSPWAHPRGSFFIHNDGKMSHYTESGSEDCLQTELVLRQGDVVGALLEESKVRFSHNGSLIEPMSFDNSGCSSSLFPAVHVMKKGIQLKGNFKGPFKLNEQNQRLIMANRRVSIRIEEAPRLDNSNDMISSFLQFDMRNTKNDCPGAAGHRRLSNVPSRTPLKSKSQGTYNIKESSYFYRPPNAFPLFHSGAFEPRFMDPLDDDDDSDLDSNDEDPRIAHEDLNSLLVKSWETNIFPIIRRRFRNDSERRDGLEQIKGALSLGMTDIARQTVEFLYEEGGGIPGDLHLPTLEDVKEDLSKLSIEGLKKGMLLSIGDITHELAYKIGPPSLIETSNNSGEVLEVDTENELVQVETYLKLKGVLVRFWYPISCLTKSTGANNSSLVICPINTGAFDIHNPDIHREVLNMEFALSRIYCRSAYINLLLFATRLKEIDFEHENESLLSNVMMLQDSDPENLRLLSESLFIKSDIYGNILDANIHIHQYQRLFELFNGDLSKLFYYPCNSEVLAQEIQRLHERYGSTSEILEDVTDCLKNPSKYFITEEIEINDLSILRSIVRFDNCAFVSVSFKNEKDFTNYEDLVIQIQTLNGMVLKPNGRSMARDVIQYPVGKGFPPVFISEEMLQVSHGGGGIENRPSLYLHGIHRDFPLAIITLETLLTQRNDSWSRSVGENATVLLLDFLSKYSCPLLLKERIFDLIRRCLQSLPSPRVTLKNHPSTKNLEQELRHLYSKESKENDFSSYFISLNELVLTMAEAFKESSLKDPWFEDILEIVQRCTHWESMELLSGKINPNDFERLLIITDISGVLSVDEIRTSILKVVDPLGGVYNNSELFVTEVSGNERSAVLQVRFACKINQIICELEGLSSLRLQGQDKIYVSKFKRDMGESDLEYEPLLEYLSSRISQENTLRKGRMYGNKIELVEALMEEEGLDLTQQCTHVKSKQSFSLLDRHRSIVKEVNELCKDYSMSPSDIHPNELYDRRYDLKVIQNLNEVVKRSKLLSMITLRNKEWAPTLTSLLFTSTKTDFWNGRLVNLRDTNLAPPEISLNPVADIGITKEDSDQTWFVQAMHQLTEVDSRQFCVNFATGGDPELPLLVKMQGEEVLGNSGSFRAFLSQATTELQSRAIPLFVPNLGSERKGLWTMRYDEGHSYNTEKYLQFFGQLMGMALRAGIPLALNLMPQNWKTLVGEELDERDLKDFDPCSYYLISKIQSLKNEDEFENFLEDAQFPKMSVLDVSGAERELVTDGSSTYLTWSNHHEYVLALKDFKMREMSSSQRWMIVKSGLATIIPLNLFLSLFQPYEIEEILCGTHKVNIRYIKEHTIYQVGIKESDPHVQYFWSVLETLSTSQMSRFIKFCCNQDRIQTWSEENLPPYPMKIAPANRNPDDLESEHDQRHIRVETCMFMIKLPRYSSYEVMREKILFAISSANDPLSG